MNIINHKNSVKVQLNSANVCKTLCQNDVYEAKPAISQNHKKLGNVHFLMKELQQKKRPEVYSDRFICFLFNCFHVCLRGKVHNIINAK